MIDWNVVFSPDQIINKINRVLFPYAIES